MAGIAEQADFHRPDAAVELVVDDLEVGIGGPGEVVDILGVEGDGLGAVAVVALTGLYASRADDVVLRQRDLHVIGAEVGEELGHGVELVAVPCSMPPDADFGKPLSGEQEGALVAGAGDDLGELGAELDSELHILAGRYRTRQLHLEDRLVVGIAVVGRDELHLVRQVAHARRPRTK